MDRINTDTAVNGLFVDGDFATGQRATQLNARTFNFLQEELVNLVVGSGQQLSERRDQVLAAVRSFVSATPVSARTLPRIYRSAADAAAEEAALLVSSPSPAVLVQYDDEAVATYLLTNVEGSTISFDSAGRREVLAVSGAPTRAANYQGHGKNYVRFPVPALPPLPADGATLRLAFSAVSHGQRGWSPSIVVEEWTDSSGPDPVQKAAFKLEEWIGGEGAAPTDFVGQYLSAAGGFVADREQALNLLRRGPAGQDGRDAVSDILKWDVVASRFGGVDDSGTLKARVGAGSVFVINGERFSIDANVDVALPSGDAAEANVSLPAWTVYQGEDETTIRSSADIPDSLVGKRVAVFGDTGDPAFCLVKDKRTLVGRSHVLWDKVATGQSQTSPVGRGSNAAAASLKIKEILAVYVGRDGAAAADHAPTVSTHPPSAASDGDRWYDLSTHILKEYGFGTWSQVENIPAGYFVENSGTLYTRPAEQPPVNASSLCTVLPEYSDDGHRIQLSSGTWVADVLGERVGAVGDPKDLTSLVPFQTMGPGATLRRTDFATPPTNWATGIKFVGGWGADYFKGAQGESVTDLLDCKRIIVAFKDGAIMPVVVGIDSSGNVAPSYQGVGGALGEIRLHRKGNGSSTFTQFNRSGRDGARRIRSTGPARSLGTVIHRAPG